MVKTTTNKLEVWLHLLYLGMWKSDLSRAFNFPGHSQITLSETSESTWNQSTIRTPLSRASLLTTDPPSKQKKNFFVTFYHSLLNEIWFFAWMGHFWKIPCPSKTFLLPICLLCACKGRERVFPFFLRLAALCMVLLRRFKILLREWSGGIQTVHLNLLKAIHFNGIFKF